MFESISIMKTKRKKQDLMSPEKQNSLCDFKAKYKSKKKTSENIFKKNIKGIV